MATSYSQSASGSDIPGLPESVRLLLASAAGYLHARFQLLGLEAKDAALTYVKIIILLITAVVFMVFGYIFFVIAAAYLVHALFHWHWGWVLLGFGVAHLAITVTCLLLAKSHFSAASFPETIAEFKKDKEWLSQTKPSTPLPEPQRRKDELTAELARARSGISLHAGQVSYQADVSRRLKSSFRGHVGSVAYRALLTGGFISFLPARQKKVYINPLAKNSKGKLELNTKPPQNFFISLIKALVPIFKPMLTAFITKQLANVVGGAKEAQHTAERTTEAAQETTETAERTAEKAAA